MIVQISTNVYNNDIDVSNSGCSAQITIQTPVPTANIEVISGGATNVIGAKLPIIEKADGNTGGSAVIEINDKVFFKEVLDGDETVMLLGHTYIGGDVTLRSSYEQKTIIDT